MPTRYRAFEDPLFRGTWRVEPINYAGRGFVYLFNGSTARQEATAWEKEKNRQYSVSHEVT